MDMNDGQDELVSMATCFLVHMNWMFVCFLLLGMILKQVDATGNLSILGFYTLSPLKVIW